MQWINAAKYRILISISIRAYSYPSEKTALNGHIDRYLYTFGFDSTTFSIHRLIYGCPFISCDCDCFETFGFFRYTDFNLNRKTYHTLLNMLYFKPWAHLSGIHFYRILFCLVFSESKGNWKYTWNFEQTNKFELLFQYMFYIWKTNVLWIKPSENDKFVCVCVFVMWLFSYNERNVRFYGNFLLFSVFIFSRNLLIDFYQQKMGDYQCQVHCIVVVGHIFFSFSLLLQLSATTAHMHNAKLYKYTQWHTICTCKASW